MKCHVVILYLLGSLIISSSCQRRERKNATEIVNEWMGKEVLFPKTLDAIIDGKFVEAYSTDHAGYVIVSYVDSVGCASCKLQLRRWREVMMDIDSFASVKIPVLLFLNTKGNDDIYFKLKWDDYSNPVFLDEKDAFNKLNGFPTNSIFQTFLLNSENRVVAIGNPIHNPKVKELYMNIILGDKAPKQVNASQTDIQLNETSVDMGKFDWHKEQKAVFTLTNTGESPLVIIDVATSCGCVSTSYSKEPVRPGKEISLNVTYKADHPEHFNKTITVYCNTKASPLKLKIKGNAE